MRSSLHIELAVEPANLYCEPIRSQDNHALPPTRTICTSNHPQARLSLPITVGPFSMKRGGLRLSIACPA